MKIAMISDLHTDINEEYPVVELTAARAKELKADVLLVAGDISEDPDRTVREMRRLAEILPDTAVRYVPGNHDMWNKHCPERSTEEIYRMYSGDILCLSGQVSSATDREKNMKVRFTGDIGWYDYSLASPDHRREELDSMTAGGRTWQDKLFNQWTGDNDAACRDQLSRIESQLSACGEGPVIAVTHMLPIREFCVPESQDGWGFFNAYLGTEKLHELFRKYPVAAAVCGHVHYRKVLQKDGILYICPCLGYHTEWPLCGLADNEPATHVADAMQLLEL
ncbi:metallophosphoesterase family protein [[Clostridium] aminophilum]|uniref:metallophosphoesterase family protein n=1 Tax=[Clostridium] aminophilum TaxID=1526 RepID=UPI003333926B